MEYHARFGGVDWVADVPLPDFDAAAGMGRAGVAMRLAPPHDFGGDITRIGRADIANEGLRFRWGDEASFDLIDGCRIGWQKGPAWSGHLPVGFYSSLAALALAWQGRLPLHASAVVIEGRAWLLAGAAGAGKSTLTAELLGAGASLLADDLTILTTGEGIKAWRGRPAMRLHPDTAAAVASSRPAMPTTDGRGKLLVWPQARAQDCGWPVGGLLLLGGAQSAKLTGAGAAMAYGSVLFRPKMMGALPMRAGLRQIKQELARQVPAALLPAVCGFDGDARARRIDAALGAIARLASAKA